MKKSEVELVEFRKERNMVCLSLINGQRIQINTVLGRVALARLSSFSGYLVFYLKELETD